MVTSAWGRCLTASAFLAVVTKDGVYVLDLAAKVDATADYICKVKWGDIEFPPPFGREAYPEVRLAGGMECDGGGAGDQSRMSIGPPLWVVYLAGKGRWRAI